MRVTPAYSSGYSAGYFTGEFKFLEFRKLSEDEKVQYKNGFDAGVAEYCKPKGN